MVLIGLLLVALVCLALGLILASAGWLVASLAVTAIAAYVMWTKRAEISTPAAKASESDAGTDAAAAATRADEHSVDPDDHSVVDPEYQQRREAWFAEGTAEGEVWVVDGQPDYHVAGCRVLVGEKAEPVPFAQATEDGFTPCAVCEPDSTVADPADSRAATPAVAAPASSAEPAVAPHRGDVWVVDGRPNYHQAGCALLAGLDAEPIPLEQAVEDGFTPCPECSIVAEHVAEPLPVRASVIATRPVPTPQEAAARDRDHGQVWVVDGRPRYHRSDCMIIKGQDAEPIPYQQAIDDGFMPCSLCDPNGLSH